MKKKPRACKECGSIFHRERLHDVIRRDAYGEKSQWSRRNKKGKS